MMNAAVIDICLFSFTYSKSPWNSMLNEGILFKDCPMDKGVITV